MLIIVQLTRSGIKIFIHGKKVMKGSIIWNIEYKNYNISKIHTIFTIILNKI